MAQTRRNLAYSQYLGSFLVEIWVFDPRGVLFLGSLNYYAVEYEDIASRFNLNYFFVFTMCYLRAQTGRTLT